MPPYLAIPHFHLSKLPITTKIVLSLFLLSLFSGILFVGATFYPSRLSEEEESAKNFTDKTGDSLLGLKSDFAKHQIMKATDEMKKGLEENDRRHAFMVVHPHSFLMPVVYFILTHLCEMTLLALWFKITLYVTSFIAMMLSIFAPVLIWYSVKFAPFCHFAFYTMLVSYSVIIINSFVQLWKKPGSV
ncbi:MAG: hypothetical protein HY606_08240 [Planctomycetes bacterium]|nr:hypothetical protein [Planctomycetota bacterium]